MGVLETRNLDFKNVFILSLNEGAFPSTANKNSYIPYNIKKAYGLPTLAHQDAMYSYLFYRILQRAENIFMFYNSETDAVTGRCVELDSAWITRARKTFYRIIGL